MTLEQDIEEIRSGIEAGQFRNEASVSLGIVIRLLHALGWPTYNPQIVYPEYPVEAGRVDYALCHPAGRPKAFIEVKQIGGGVNAERQLFEYAFYRGIPLLILTDGREWNFFLALEEGEIGDRRVYKLDLVERSTAESKLRLSRYLQYNAVVSGAAIDAAHADYRDAARHREVKARLPQAWDQLVQEEDELLLELVRERVEKLCGYKPDLDTIGAFLKENVILRPAVPMVVQPPPHVPDQSRQVEPPPGVGFTLNEHHHSARTALDVLTQVFEEFTRRDPSFPERFAALPTHGRTRRYLARTAEELYADRPDLARDYSRQLNSGWWLGTNLSRQSIARIIEMACNVAGLVYGRDLRVDLGA